MRAKQRASQPSPPPPTPQRGVPRARTAGSPETPSAAEDTSGTTVKKDTCSAFCLPLRKLAHSPTPSPRGPRHLLMEGRGLRSPRKVDLGLRKRASGQGCHCGPPRPPGVLSPAWPGAPRPPPSPYLAAEGWDVRLSRRSLPWTWRAAARCPSAPLPRGLRLRSHRCAPSGCASCTDALSGPPRCTDSARVRLRTRPPSHLARCPRTAWARCAGPSRTRTRVCVTPQLTRTRGGTARAKRSWLLNRRATTLSVV